MEDGVERMQYRDYTNEQVKSARIHIVRNRFIAVPDNTFVKYWPLDRDQVWTDAFESVVVVVVVVADSFVQLAKRVDIGMDILQDISVNANGSLLAVTSAVASPYVKIFGNKVTRSIRTSLMTSTDIGGCCFSDGDSRFP
jgi:hypothetical protein